MILIKTYTPAKRAIVSIFFTALLLMSLGTAIFAMLALADRKLALVLLICFWALSAMVMVFGVPRYYRFTKLDLSPEEICYRSGFISDSRQYMPTSSVKSVTTIITPMSRYTGLNFVIINALGSKIIVPFMRKSDCREATEYINSLIKARDGNAETLRSVKSE